MKKRYLLLLLLSLFWFPFSIDAKEGITNFFIDATVQENGDIKVKEVVVLNGEFNGFERIIDYRNSNAPIFNGSQESFEGSDIYNGSGIIVEAIGEIPLYPEYHFDILQKEPTLFTENEDAAVGYYDLYENLNGVTIRSFMPSNGESRAFYFEYTLQNMAIVHQDVAEIGWNFFSNELSEYIEHLEIYIHIPGNQNGLYAWAHGPLNGNIEVVDQETIKITVDDLNAYTAIDTRFVFNKEVVPTSTKTTDVEALPSILEVERLRAEEANRERLKARILYYGLMGLNGVWLVGLGALIFYMYCKYDKEYKSDFMGKYFRDFPKPYGPEIVGYLFRKQVNTNELSAAILNLIADKVVKFNKLGKKDYELIYEPAKRDLKESDQTLIAWLFGNIGSDNRVTLSAIKKAAKSNYDSFLTNYEKWKNQVLKEANQYHFFEASSKAKGWSSLYSVLGIILSIITMVTLEILFLPIVVLGASVVSLIYFATITKRTKEGNNDYAKWKGLKNFLNDFGSFETKDLPQVTLWEKYLVYATVFGFANKVAKTMKIKFEEMPQSTYTTTDLILDVHYFNVITAFNRTINTSMNSAVNTAISTRSAAQSNNSSSGGFGGGFSSGGGSFGGGGGGGRF